MDGQPHDRGSWRTPPLPYAVPPPPSFEPGIHRAWLLAPPHGEHQGGHEVIMSAGPRVEGGVTAVVDGEVEVAELAASRLSRPGRVPRTPRATLAALRTGSGPRSSPVSSPDRRRVAARGRRRAGIHRLAAPWKAAPAEGQCAKPWSAHIPPRPQRRSAPQAPL